MLLLLCCSILWLKRTRMQWWLLIVAVVLVLVVVASRNIPLLKSPCSDSLPRGFDTLLLINQKEGIPTFHKGYNA